MRILLLSNDFSPNGGVGKYVVQLAQALGAELHNVTVIHRDNTASMNGPLGVESYLVPGFDAFAQPPNSSATREVLTLIDRCQPDIVHVHGCNNFELERQIRQSVPVVKTLHVYDFCPSGGRYHFALGKICQHQAGWLCLPRIVYKRCLRSKRPWVWWEQFRRFQAAQVNNQGYSKLIVASHYVKRVALQEGYPDAQVEVVPYFAEIPDSIEPLPDQPTLLFVGRIYPEKGLDQLLRAFALVPRGTAHLDVVGDGPALPEAKALARKLGVADEVTFHGWRQDLDSFYRRAWVLIVPSLWPEPFGIVGIEAMSHARPVVAFAVGGIPEWLEDTVSGFLIRPYNASEMAERIRFLLERPEVARQMGRRGRERGERDFNQKKHVTTLLEVYQEVMAHAKKLCYS